MKHKKENNVVLIKNWCKNLFAQPQPQFYIKPMLYISGNEMELKNFLQILEYTDVYLSVKSKNGFVCIYGTNLLVQALEKDRIIIKGTILKIEFLPQEEKSI